MYSTSISSQLGGEPPLTGARSLVDETNSSVRRLKALKRVDKELSRGNFTTAVSVVKQLRSLRGFGAYKQVSKRICSVDELDLKLNVNEISSLKSLIDSVMESIEKSTDFASLDEETGGLESSAHNDEDGDYIALGEEDHFMCIQHEAGHFLVGYLLGVLPKAYKVPSIESLRQGNCNAARVEFVGFDFLKEMAISEMIKTVKSNKGIDKSRLSSKTLNNFSCVILGGLVAEQMVFGYSQGHHADIEKLERVFKWLEHNKAQANHQTKWAVLNTAIILHSQTKARSKLAESMAIEKPISSCINTIEQHLNII